MKTKLNNRNGNSTSDSTVIKRSGSPSAPKKRIADSFSKEERGYQPVKDIIGKPPTKGSSVQPPNK